MPVQGIKTVATARNGLSAFTLPITRLSLTYCSWSGSSRGLNSFLTSTHLPSLTRQYPSVEFRISPRPHKHPVLHAYYVNGREKAVCVRNLSMKEVEEKLKLLLGNDGSRNRKLGSRKVVSGGQEGVRGVWSAHHGGLKDV